MALRRYSFSVSACFVFLQLSLLVSPIECYKPQILSKYETIIEVGDNFTVLCQGNTQLNWSWPEVQIHYSKWTTVEFTDVLPRDNIYKHASRLFVQNATFVYTGFYKCFGQNVDPSDDDQVAQIYLYVRDDEHLSVKDTEVDTVLATQFNDVVLPCRPTSPDVRVELTLVTGEKVPLDVINEDGTMYRYHPHFGFFTNHTKTLTQDVYYCTFTRDSKSAEIAIILDVEVRTFSLPTPKLEDLSGGHTDVGDELRLECKIRALTVINFSWMTPTGPPDLNRMELSPIRRPESDSGISYQELSVKKTRMEDNGFYACNVSDNQNHNSSAELNVKIYDVNEHFINLTEENGVYIVSVNAGEPFVRWRIDVEGHPRPQLSWRDQHYETIQNGSDKYMVNFGPSEALLTINNIAITDFGNYTLVAETKFENKSLTVFLNVTDKPTVLIKTENFYLVNSSATVKCIAAAYPKPTIQWSFKPCHDDSCMFKPMKENRSEAENLNFISYLILEVTQSGLVNCSAKNALGVDEMVQSIYVTDVDNGLGIIGFDSTVYFNTTSNEAKIATGEKIKITCAASVYNYSSDIIWYHGGKVLENDDKYTIEKNSTKYTNRATLSFENIEFIDGGNYSCKVWSNSSRSYHYKTVSLLVMEPSKPEIHETNMGQNLEIFFPSEHKFSCSVSGFPKPKITWFKDGKTIEPNERISIINNNQILRFNKTEIEDEGKYKCVAKNKIDQIFKEASLHFKNNPNMLDKWLMYPIIVLAVIVAIAGVFIVIKIRNEKKLQKELQIAGLANFEKGALENLNPDLGIDDQAELLPYDKKWEFPIEKLKLGKQLGSGAFGVVMKGEAKSIVEDEETTIVAVKMVKKNAGHTYIKALASELKIMVHLGKHLNVVNLLGACTKNVAKRELLVIVEYCRYGNVQNYLLRHRDAFIDQVNPNTGHLDQTIGQEILERSYSVSSTRSTSHSPLMKYAVMSFSNSNSGGSQVPHDMVDYRANDYNGMTAKTDMTTVSMCPNSGDDEVVLSSNNSSVQPEWRSNYRGDYKGNVRPIGTKDLLAWAFQVSRGMEYLASRRVLHGDLAARNILLTDNNVVKICDFGLAKSMYKNDNYKKKGDGPLPIKWMAIESIRDKIFSTQSDVWSFGIVLWEFFSLARTPYPGMEADERLYNKLVDGYRMESPQYAPKEVYKMMLDCWQVKPLSRPSFSRLAERIGSMLEDTVRQHYIDLNDPYLVMNTQRLENGHSDYLAMMSPPNFESLSSPHQYANDLPPSENTPGYLCMKPASIFSPRADDDRIFDFDEVPSKSKRDKSLGKGTGNELAPMLGVNSESDCENSVCNSPIVPNSFSNPSYHLPPIVEKDQNKSERDLVRFADNYVNIPQSKNVLKENNNPFVKIGNGMKDVNYVNSSSRDWESLKL